MNRRLIEVGTVLLCAGLLAACQRSSSDAKSPKVTAENYANAEKWLKGNAFAKVKNLFVKPYWIAGEDHLFWYQRETAQGHEFTLVDAASGEKSGAFDHQALAAELQRLGEKEVDAAKLPLTDLVFADKRSGMTFAVNDDKYRCGLAPLKCERQRQAVPDGVLASPDGRWGIKTQKDNIVLVDLKQGTQRPLTQDGQPHFGYGIYYGNWYAAYVPRERAGKPVVPMASQWGPGSQYVLVSRLDERHVAEYPFMESAPADGSFRPKVHLPRIPLTGEEPPKLEWFIIHVPSGRKVHVDLPYEKLLYMHEDWTALADFWWDEPAGKLRTIAYGDNKGSAYFFEIDLRTGKARSVVEEQMSPRMDLNSTPYNPPNVRWLPKSGNILWFSQRSGWGHLYLYDGATGKLKNAVTQGDWLVRDLIAIDEDRQRIYFTAGGKEPGDPYHRYLYRVNYDGSDLTLLTPEKADHMVTTPANEVWASAAAEAHEVLSPDKRFAVYNYSRIDDPTRTAIVSTDGGTPKIFETADAKALYDDGWRNPEPFVAKAADGKTDLYGLLYKPAKIRSGVKYPIVDRQYASPLTAVVPHNFMTAILGPSGRARAASMAELDFAVVAIDARGTTFRSREFSHYSNGNLNTIGLEDHISAIRELAKKNPWMDIDRVGIDGASYGGFTVFRAMFEFPDFFKVGASEVGTGSVSSMYPDSHWEAYHGRVKYANGGVLRTKPDERPVNYLNNDNSLQSKNLKGKLLITLCELDENVLPGSTLQVIDSLVRADKDFDMYYFPNEPHRVRSPFLIRKIWDYFVRNLHGQEAPEYHITSTD